MKRVVNLTLGALSFAYLIFVLNPVQMLSLLLYPISPAAVRRINRWCARSIWGFWVLMGERLLGMQIDFRGEELPRRENALVLPNHQSMADVFLLLCLAWRCGRIGDLKWFAKDALKYVPGPGWGMWLLDCIFLRRDWTKDKAGILSLFEKYKKHDIPIFLVSFLEGTRLTKSKLAGAQEFARTRERYVPRHTLVPRTKGFVATMLGLRTHIDAVYDVTIGYPGETPTLFDCFLGRVDRLELHVTRFPVDALPEGEEALSQWVFDRFEVKDQLMRGFVETGSFPGETRYAKPTLIEYLSSEARPSSH